MTINELLDLIKLNFIYKEGYLYWAIEAREKYHGEFARAA